ncbi:MAG: ABC transporter ATP-binding protein [Proteobacteria bacterium]|nr:ABC transporter ATP-binding protein [Pseudomonadota bacterium]
MSSGAAPGGAVSAGVDASLTGAVSAAAPVGTGALLSLERLNVIFSSRYGNVHAVRDLSLSVAPGECLGVVGESGAGKSQAFLAALGLLSTNGRATGRALFGATDLLTLRQPELDRIRGARIGMVFQDPMTSLTPHMRIGDQIAEPIIKHMGVSEKEAQIRALALLNQVHVTDAERRMRQYPHELSGGMRQRVMVAIALSCDPELLIADEPTTALDVTIQAQILALLAELKRSRGMSMVLITHDMGAVAGVADRVAVMRGGAVVEVGSVGAVFKAPQHAYTRGLLAAVASVAGGGAVAGAGAAARDPGTAARDPGTAARDPGTAARDPGTAARDPGTAARDPGTAPVPTLALNDIHVQFKVRTTPFGKQQMLRAVDGVSLALAPGEALGVVGESGSGKSTLARAALQLLRPQSGRVVWFGREVDALAPSALRPLRRDVQVVFQDPLASLDPRMTAGEIVAEPLRVHRADLGRAGRDAAVARALELVRLDPALATRYPHELSGGQCQRVGIARAMVTQPQLLICDEPISALDVTVQEQIVNLLADLKREAGVAILFISHNLAVVRQLCDRILVLYLGRMMELAPAESIYARPRHPYSGELLASAPIPDPDVQPSRLARTLPGEPPSPLSPPSGCVYRTRCPHALPVCAERVPSWETQGTRWVACHRWRELAL